MRILTMSLTIKEPPMLKDIKTAEYPLERLVEAGFTQLGLNHQLVFCKPLYGAPRGRNQG